MADRGVGVGVMGRGPACCWWDWEDEGLTGELVLVLVGLVRFTGREEERGLRRGGQDCCDSRDEEGWGGGEGGALR